MSERCEACGRKTAKLYRHHQVPASQGGRHGPIRMCCRTCAKQVHMLFTEAEMAGMGWDELLATPQMQRYLDWVAKRPGEFPSKKSKRIRRR